MHRGVDREGLVQPLGIPDAFRVRSETALVPIDSEIGEFLIGKRRFTSGQALLKSAEDPLAKIVPLGHCQSLSRFESPVACLGA